MAWWVKTEIDDMHGKRIFYETECIGDSLERYKAAIEQTENALITKYNLPRPWPLPYRAPVHDPLHGAGPESGFRLPMPERPYQVRFKEEVGYIASILPVSIGHAITEFVRDAIEEIEPGVHQYLPCEIFFQDGMRLDEERWILNICNRLDTIAVEHSNIALSPNTSRYLPGNGPFDVKVWKDKVAGKAIWCEWRYGFYTFAADALVERLRRADIHGFEFYKYLPEV